MRTLIGVLAICGFVVLPFSQALAQGMGGGPTATLVGIPGCPECEDPRDSGDGDVGKTDLAPESGPTVPIPGGTGGTKTPTTKLALDVLGDIRASGCYLDRVGRVVGGTCVSDIRVKRNVKELAHSLDAISALRPVRFAWRTDEYSDLNLHDGTATGLIAQDVEHLFPNLVTTNADGLKAVRYGIALQMHMIQAIKELKAENDDVRARLTQLEDTINSLQELRNRQEEQAQAQAVTMSVR